MAALLVDAHAHKTELFETDSINRILRAARDHLKVEIAFVSRFLPEGLRELTHINADIALPMDPGFREPQDQSFCWHVLEGRLPELIHDTSDYPLALSLPITTMLPVGCHLNTPLRLSDGTVWGSFCCLSRTPDRSLGDRDIEVLRAFAALAAEQIESVVARDPAQSPEHAAISGVIASGALQIFHQPIVKLHGGAVVGVECLSRFADAAERGPDKWFDEAGRVGLKTELEILAILNSLQTLNFVPQDCYVSINASPETVMSGLLQAALQNHDPSRIVIELTEHDPVEDFRALKRRLTELSPHVRLAIDDVGAGYAGLRYIVDLEPAILKLDISLTRDVHLDPARRSLTKAMVHLAQEIGCKLVAEGVESVAELDCLAELGVQYGQGYLFARPMPVLACQRFIAGNRLAH